MSAFTTGDVFQARVRDRVRYVRVGYTDPGVAAAGRVYVQDCDGAGFLLSGTGRHLRATTLANRWRLHFSPTREASA